MMRVPPLSRLARTTLLWGTLMAVEPCLTLGADISPADRDAIFEGALQGCDEKMPEAIRQRVGVAAVLNFCYCYSNEVARTITDEQIDALADWSRPPTAIPHYGETMRNAWRACEKQLLTKTP